MKLPIAYYGDPVLRKKCERINEINDDIRQLVDDMVETMHANDGMGLAAPQVHRSLTLFLTCVPILGEDGKFKQGNLRIFLNPKILAYSEDKWTHDEACISIPKLYGHVTRPVRISIEATDLDGNTFQEEFTGLDARVFLHENDHINGVLYIDRMHGKERQELEPYLRELKKRFSKK